VAPCGGLARVVDGVGIPYEAKPARDAAELRALIRLRDAMGSLRDLEAAGADDVASDLAAQPLLRRVRGSVRSRSTASRRCAPGGPTPRRGRRCIGRPCLRWAGSATIRTTARCWRSRSPDAETQRATKAAIFTARVIAPRAP
jgi:hypothetical protein